MRICVKKALGDGRALDIRTELCEGEILALVGASGVGKTTLLNILSGLTDYEGQLEGVPQKVGYVFQENRLLPHLTAIENLLYAGASEREAVAFLGLVGMEKQMHVAAKKLSGGEKRRVALGRAFLSKAELLLLDEPFTALDTAKKIELCRLFIELWEREKPTVVLVTHDIEEAFMLGHRVASIVDGKIAAEVRVDGEPFAYGRGSAQKQAILKSFEGGASDGE